MPQTLKAAQRRIRVLERALEPFAQESTNWCDSVSSRYRPGVTEPRQTQAYAKADFTLADLRRAHRLVATA